MQVRIPPFRRVAGALMSIKVEPKAKAPAGHRQEERKADYIKRGENILIEVVQSAVFGALTTGRIKPHEVIVIEGDHIGTLAGKLSGLRYLVEQELIEDEPTSDEEDEEVVEGAIEGAVEGTAETVEGETESTVSTEAVESPQEPKAKDIANTIKEERKYKYDTIKTARNTDGTPVLPVHKAVSLNDSGMTAREIADKYSIRDARSVAQAVRQYGARFHREPKEPYKVDVQGLSKAREDKDEDS